MKRSRSDVAFDVTNVILIIGLMVIMVYPLYFTIIASVSDPTAVAGGDVSFVPVGFSLEAYSNVFRSSAIWMGYRNSLVYTLLGTILSLFLTLPAGYALSKKFLPGRSAISWFFLVPMYFSGGLIPTYILVRNLGLLNKPYTLIVLGGVSIFYVIVTRIYFETSVPDEIYEAAEIDGASEFVQFFRIALPLALPIVAVMALFYGVARWNDYYTALIYVSKTSYQPLQMVLRSILIQNQSLMDMLSDPDLARNITDDQVTAMMRRAHMAQTMKYALIFIASAPMLVAYPFVQKYFVKGVMIGSLKG